jgi:hypothetical protein
VVSSSIRVSSSAPSRSFSDTWRRAWFRPRASARTPEEILAWLGYDDARIAELKVQGVVTWPDENYAAW